MKLDGSNLGGSPVMRKKFGDPGDGMNSDSGENVLEPHEWIDAGALAGRRETAQNRGGVAALVAAKEHPIIPPHRNTADRALGGVVIDLQISVLAVAR